MTERPMIFNADVGRAYVTTRRSNMGHFIYLDNALLNGEDLHTVTATFDVAAGIAFIDLGDGRSLQLDRAHLHDLLAELPAPPDDQEPPYLNEPWKY